MEETKERIAKLEKQRDDLLAKGLSVKNVEEALVDEVTYLRSLEAKAAKKDQKAAAAKAKAEEAAAAKKAKAKSEKEDKKTKE